MTRFDFKDFMRPRLAAAFAAGLCAVLVLGGILLERGGFHLSLLDSSFPAKHSTNGVADPWLKQLTEGEALANSLEAMDTLVPMQSLITAAQQSEEQFSTELKNIKLHPFTRPEHYFLLATRLAEIKDHIRILHSDQPDEIARAKKSISLLSTLIDETLYAMAFEYPKDLAKNKEWRWVPHSNSQKTCEEAQRLHYYGISLCRGDIILSKSEAFSSSLFWFRSPDSGAHSHASIPYLPADADLSKGPTQLLEAEPTGGLFDDPATSNEPAKFAVYRYKHDEDRPKIEASLDQIVKLRGANPSFNFQLKPECSPGRYFCTEAIFCAYQGTGLGDAANPYSKNYWSASSSLASEFIGKISESYPGPIPMAGDMELSPAFDLVATAVQMQEVAELRVRGAVVRAFAHLMHDDSSLRETYLAALDQFKNRRLSDLKEGTHELDYLNSLNLPIPNKLEALRRQLPPDVRLKEIAFYFHFQTFMLTQVSEDVMNLSRKSSKHAMNISELEEVATPELRVQTRQFVELMSRQETAVKK